MKNERDLITRAIRDAEFRGKLLKDPEGVLSSEGYEVNPELRERIVAASAMTPQALEAAIVAAAREGSAGT